MQMIAEVRSGFQESEIKWLVMKELGDDSGIIVYQMTSPTQTTGFNWYADRKVFERVMRDDWGISPNDWHPYQQVS